jgi:glyoxylase-like metal-dependent hydrolase (beta-lactamase superfamily II)
MKKGFRLGEFELFWLGGGTFELDGGAMFGVVPKVLWSKKYPAGDDNTISMVARPLLIKTPESLVLIETGLGNKLTEKQKQIFRVKEEWSLIGDLETIGVNREDIDCVILTHYDFDHAGGVVMKDQNSGGYSLTFPRAKYVLQAKEWEDVINPNIRSINTYWPLNNELLRGSPNLELLDGDGEIVKGIGVVHAGGHTKGFQVVTAESQGQTAVYLCDLLPTHAHFNPLWIMAYDNFPLESIQKKAALEKEYIGKGAWFAFYHDPYVLACKFDEQGNILEKWPEETA